MEYQSGQASETSGDAGSYQAPLLNRVASVFMVVLLLALGVKLISNGVNTSGDSSNIGLIKLLFGTAALAIAVPILGIFSFGFG